MQLSGEHIFLRPVEKEDVHKLILWENNPKHWKVSGTEVPFSMSAMLDYIEQAQHIRSHGQLRLLIGDKETKRMLGAVDLYNADFKNRRAAIGILIAEETDRQHGYASEALALVEQYARDILAFHNVYCSIQDDNAASIKLFERAGFEFIGRRKEWYLVGHNWLDELLYQKCLRKD